MAIGDYTVEEDSAVLCIFGNALILNIITNWGTLVINKHKQNAKHSKISTVYRHFIEPSTTTYCK